MLVSARMWTVPIEALSDRRGLRGEVRLDGATASFDAVCRGLEHDAQLRAALGEALASAPYPAYRWETPAVTLATFERHSGEQSRESVEMIAVKVRDEDASQAMK